MEIIISNNANKPIYEQITSQIKAMIMSGELQAGDAIPSMRSLAKSIHVSVITVQKAYEDLQRDGFHAKRSAPAMPPPLFPAGVPDWILTDSPAYAARRRWYLTSGSPDPAKW